MGARLFVLIAASAAVAAPALSRGATDTWTDASGNGVWSQALNWSGLFVPNNGNGGIAHWDVVLGAPAPTNLDIGVTIDTLNVQSAGHLNLLNNTSLTLVGASLVDDGGITVNSNQGGSATSLVFGGDATLSGAGTVLLNQGGGAAQLNTSAGTLTQTSTHTIAGFGQINASLNNLGTVNSNTNGQVLVLQTSPKANQNLLEATNGGTLDINGIAITNSGGTITAADKSAVDLDNGASITGGTLKSSGSGVIQNVTGTGMLADVTVAAGTPLNILNNTSVTVSGTLTNNGTITINSNQGGSATVLSFSGNATLAGSGQVVLHQGAAASQLNTAPGGTVTQAAGHTISGLGQINAALTNQGTVNADVNGQTLFLLSNPKTNTGMLQATNGGTLDINGIALTNTGGTISAGNASTVNLDNGASIIGGTLQATGTGVFQNTTGGGTLNNVTIATGTPLNILNNTSMSIAGTLTNDGTISINSNQGGSRTTLNFGAGASLAGSGALVVDSAGRAMFATNSPALTEHLGSLVINGSGVVDLGNNNIQIPYTTGQDPAAAIQSYISSGALTSSLGDANHVVAVGDTADGTVAGSPDTIFIRLVLPGDVNLDGRVNFTDLVILAANYQKNGAHWDQGDFNGDGNVGFDDLVKLAAHYGQSIAAIQTASLSDAGRTFRAVPEPAVIGALGLLGGLLRQRRK